MSVKPLRHWDFVLRVDGDKLVVHILVLKEES